MSSQKQTLLGILIWDESEVVSLYLTGDVHSRPHSFSRDKSYDPHDTSLSFVDRDDDLDCEWKRCLKFSRYDLQLNRRLETFLENLITL